ncbi:MAG: 4'-phosphopantetheinyl transferase superfamily protein [Roseivirga sp.]
MWHIKEPEEKLMKDSALTRCTQVAYKERTHPDKRKEWLAARLALKELLAKLGHKYTPLQKDAWGRPYLVDSDLHLSIAHGSSYALVAVSEQHPIGVDIQWPCQKLLSVREKFLNDHESQDIDNDLDKLCIYWCAKEAIYKAQGGRRLSLKDGICIKAFTKKEQGMVWGAVGPQLFIVHYSFYNGHVLTWGQASGCRGDHV